MLLFVLLWFNDIFFFIVNKMSLNHNETNNNIYMQPHEYRCVHDWRSDGNSVYTRDSANMFICKKDRKRLGNLIKLVWRQSDDK